MITREMIIVKLQEKYPQYNIIPQDVVKNGDVHLEGITIRDDTPIAPTIYTQSIIDRCKDDIEQAIEIISNIIEQNQAPDIDISKLNDKDFILEHIRIGVQKASDENLIKRDIPDFPGMEQYLYFAEASWSVKLRPELMASANLDEAEAWQLAEQHTFEATTIKSMLEVMTEMMGDAFDADLIDETSAPEMYIISNKEQTKGAASIINHAMLEQFAKEHDCAAIAVLPSSIHECLLIPMRDSFNIEQFDEMVREVNATQVSPEDRLVDRAYLITFD